MPKRSEPPLTADLKPLSAPRRPGRTRTTRKSRSQYAAQPTGALDRLRAVMRRALMRAGGGALVIIAVWLLVAIASFSISDPTWNTATDAPVKNLVGAGGATISDFLLQALGGAVFLIFPPLIIWGVYAFTRGTPDETSLVVLKRIALFPVSLLTAAGLGATLPIPADWPFIVGIGGALGDGVAGLLSGIMGPITAPLPAPYPAVLLGFVFGIITVLIFPVVCGLTHERAEAVAGLIETMVAGIATRTAALVTRLQTGQRAGQMADAELRDLLDQVDMDDEDQLAAIADDGSGNEDEALAVGTLDQPEDDIPTHIPGALPGGGESLASKRKIIRTDPKVKPGRRETREAQHALPVFQPGSYELPPLNLLARTAERAKTVISDDALEQNARMLETVLSDFGVRGEIINVRPGPVVTLYELEPAAGVKSSRVIGLADDIARSMSAVAARVAVVPGRNVIGIELPNQDRETVYLRSQLSTRDFEQSRADLTLSLGVDIGGEPVFADLARMPHLLIAGTTGSGKSVGINTMILSLLYRMSPDQCKLILIDPKMLELSVYDSIPHLLAPVVTDPRKAVVALKWTVREMEERYQRMSKLGVRNIAGFNERVAEAEENGETLSRTVHTGYDADSGEPIYETEEFDFEAMPFIVVVIDEVADLMMVAGKDIEGMVQRLAQMARAAGIHLIMATQRPSVDVITGTIKANFPTRISFQVTSKIDSRTILGEQGAEQLLGQGDMLYMAAGGRLRRVHGPFVSDNEVEKIVKFLKKQGKPSYVQEVTELEEGEDGAIPGLDVGGNTSSGDALYDQAVAVVLRDRKASTSYVQRRLQIGYNRAASLIEKMEQEGVISPANHAGKREILVGEDAA
ncbi:MAG: DNA translocase FtsK [Pseudomonadota bacterium]